MPEFIPPYMGEEVKSNAERKVFDLLKDLDMKEAVILHSLGLPRHNSKIFGEVDFVIVCKRGIACLEIKGGRVERQNGIWRFTDRNGNINEKTEGPFDQCKGNMFNLRNEIRTNMKHINNILFTWGVMFPDINFKKDTDTLLSNLIYEASFMFVTLKHLKEVINKKGVKEKYVNGNNQYGYKDSVEAKTYNAMIKNYISVVKQLNDELPKNKKLNPEDEFDQFNNML